MTHELWESGGLLWSQHWPAKLMDTREHLISPQNQTEKYVLMQRNRETSYVYDKSVSVLNWSSPCEMNLLCDFNTYMGCCIELYCMCVQPFLQDILQKQQECLKMQKEAVKHRVRQLAARQSEIVVSLRFLPSQCQYKSKAYIVMMINAYACRRSPRR